jgi:hypothetical protein
MEASRGGRSDLGYVSVVSAALLIWTLGSYGIAAMSSGVDGGFDAGPVWQPGWILGCVLILAVAYLLRRGHAAAELAALGIWTAVSVAQTVFGDVGVGICLRTVTGPRAGTSLCGFDEGEGDWPQLTIWAFGVVLILAIGAVVRHGPRLDSIATVVWTVGFIAVSILGRGDVICPPPQGGYTNCYLAWMPGFLLFGVWIAGVALLVAIGQIATVRRQRDPGVIT